jgi:putative ABC transport system permease protein
MLKNYFVVAVRNLYRNKYYALVNIVGLGMAMALCVVGYVNYRFSQSFNSGHRNADRIYALASYIQRDGVRQNVIQHPTPLAPTIAAEVPGVETYCRLAADGGDVRSGDLVFAEGLYFVDPDFFDMFTFKLRQGALADFGGNPSAAVITDDIARKFFGDSSAVGRRLSITMSNGRLVDFDVQTVIAEPEESISPMTG